MCHEDVNTFAGKAKKIEWMKQDIAENDERARDE